MILQTTNVSQMLKTSSDVFWVRFFEITSTVHVLIFVLRMLEPFWVVIMLDIELAYGVCPNGPPLNGRNIADTALNTI